MLSEILFLGRGGQGGKTAAFIYAKAVAFNGYYIKAFPEYGPERTGAPVKAFIRISDKPIRLHSNIYNPTHFVLLDLTLADYAKSLGFFNASIILLNANEEQAMKIKSYTENKIYYLDAKKISIEEIGKNYPNIPLIGAFEKIMNLTTLDYLKKALIEVSGAKWSKEIIEKNGRALIRGFEEVKLL
ncbi:MAG: 2-oxoacid:acceptor oxidoreductase family protein [Candidatus Woesearchaeota archaeon]